jgi:4-hydroxy-3-polyprenylbenzoate decarboxylase
MSAGNRPIVVGITGASGAAYAVRLLEVLLAADRSVHLSISPSGAVVLRQELGLIVDLVEFHQADLLPDADRRANDPRLALLRALLGPAARPTGEHASATPGGELRYHHYENLLAPMASGSALTDGMVICPCSGGTLSAIATAASGNLIQRAADVHLKEGRKLILVPRETPLSIIQLENMRRVADAGAVVLPAMPGFYHGATSIAELIDFVVARICDQLGIEHELMRRWGEKESGERRVESGVARE